MVSFLELPCEIRLIIYTYALNPNEYKKAYRKVIAYANDTDRLRGPSCAHTRPYVERYTPPILLLNRQITTEALQVLYQIPLHLYGTPSTQYTMRQMDIAEFISEGLLQKIRHAVLKLRSPNKHFVLTLLDIWGARNCLETLDVYLPERSTMSGRHWEVVESRVSSLESGYSIHILIKTQLRTFGGVVPVVFHGIGDCRRK